MQPAEAALPSWRNGCAAWGPDRQNKENRRTFALNRWYSVIEVGESLAGFRFSCAETHRETGADDAPCGAPVRSCVRAEQASDHRHCHWATGGGDAAVLHAIYQLHEFACDGRRVPDGAVLRNRETAAGC